jgi:hypothetical protein
MLAWLSAVSYQRVFRLNADSRKPTATSTQISPLTPTRPTTTIKIGKLRETLQLLLPAIGPDGVPRCRVPPGRPGQRSTISDLLVAMDKPGIPLETFGDLTGVAAR